MDIDKAKEAVERRKRSDRRQKLFEIIRLILDGKIDSSKTPLAGIFNQQGPRQTYISPQRRGGYNSGYMTMDELPLDGLYEVGNPAER
jgi:hypothetical protein